MNPYQVPGLEKRPNGPLCPIEHPQHEDFYVEVDHSETRYQEFIAAIGDSSSLSEDGRFVVVYGRERCGKTALINRCAKYVRDDLELNGKRSRIIALSNEGGLNRSVEDREKYVLGCVIDDLDMHELLEAKDLKELKSRQDDPLRAYRYLSEALPADVVLVLLLPPSEIQSELVKYASLVRKKMLLFAETAYIDEFERYWPNIREANGRADPIRLQVDRLEEEDGWRFAQARQAPEGKPPGNYPIVTKETMRTVTIDLNGSIGQLQSLLHGVYQEILEQRGPAGELTWPEMKEVSYHYIVGFYFRASGQGLRL